MPHGHCGFAQVGLGLRERFHRRLPLAGYSLMGKAARAGRELHARACSLRDRDGRIRRARPRRNQLYLAERPALPGLAQRHSLVPDLRPGLTR